MEQKVQQIKIPRTKEITFIVTKDCQLACKYCYLVGKNSNERMTWSVAKDTVDYILDNTDLFNEDNVIWDFIGGEPFLEIELIEQICDYIAVELFKRNHPWFNSYRFSFATNGINYYTEKVQNFIKKHHDHLSIGLTIDGTKRKHDMNRIWKGDFNPEKGSYDDVVRNIPLWISQFPTTGTKVTISSADIPYIAESVLHLYSLGIHEVNINVVFEDVWKEGDDKLFEAQLISLADEIIKNGWYKNHECSFFTEHIGKPLEPIHDNQNWCGAGRMLSIDAAGNFYPCTRFAAYSLRSKKPIIIGNVHDGIDKNKLRPFLTLDRTTQSRQECIDCEVASGCAWCQGENYDAADTNTIYQRATAICKMHKARVRANNYYWNKLYRKLELEGMREEFEKSKQKSNNVIC
ncbi:MAG: radical SAM peptide maturase, CXXX-repeat target family [Bacteroidaceae bacterium]|nr:radical SAM peptide maturase, CXXX-repeat target family [Bacteroidaceae bacterium]